MEQNYDIRNHELLAVKLALEEWQHWLEVSNLQTAKRLHSHQAKWALFFSC